MKELPDLYRILQVDPSADPEVIEAVYRRLARKYHPDVNPSADANRQMQDINMAYEVLGDPERRAEYDNRHRRWVADRHRASEQAYHPVYPQRAPSRRRYADDGPPHPSLTSSPDVLEFGSLARGAKGSAILKVRVTQGRTIRGRVVANQSWITISTPKILQNLTEAIVEVSIDTTHLRDGVHHYGSVTITSLAYGELTVPVTVYIPEEPKPQLRVEPEFLQFEAVKQDESVTLRSIHLWDESGCPMSGSIHVKPCWLKTDVVDFEDVSDLKVDLVADVSSLKAGQSYSGRIEVHATNGRATVLVKVKVLAQARPLPDYDSDGQWAEMLSQLEASTEWEKTFLQTINLQARQRGWKPSSSQRAIIEHLWQRHTETSCQ